MSTSSLRLGFPVPKKHEEAFGAALSLAGVQGFQVADETTLEKSSPGTVEFTTTLPQDDAARFLLSLDNALTLLGLNRALATPATRDLVPEKNWDTMWREGIEPVTLGSFYITTTWDETPPPEGTTVLRIDPGMAFGTGLHTTTQLAIQALERLHIEGYAPTTVLDLGSGTGILSMVAASLFGGVVHACEKDPKALNASRDVLRENGFTERVLLMSTPQNGAQYDLIVANINAPTLMELAPSIKGVLHPGGTLILTGIVDHLAHEVEKTYGLTLEKTVSAQEWVLFVLRNKLDGSRPEIRFAKDF